MSYSKDTFCILPFVHFYTQADGEVKPCCIASGFDEKQSLRNNSISEIFNSTEYKKLRKDMMRGKKNKVCNVCYAKEDRGEYSPRQMFNSNTLWSVPDVKKDYSVPVEFQHIDIRFSNLCNFKCRMCNHGFSSNWFGDAKKIEVDGEFPYLSDKSTKVLKASESIVDDIIPHLGKVKSFYFAGGEPLITPEHYKLLMWLYENVEDEITHLGTHKALSIHYNTNLSVIKYDEDELIKYWNSFRKVQLAISVDGIGEIGEYQRTGFKHNVFVKNLHEIQKHADPISSTTHPDGFCYSFQYTTTILNIEHIFDFIEFMLEYEFIETSETIDFYYAWSPQWMSVNNLSDIDKDRITTLFNNRMGEINSEKTKNELTAIINYMNGDRTYSINSVKNMIEQLDKVNNTDYKKILNLTF
jgi:organic radical activating enzyme